MAWKKNKRRKLWSGKRRRTLWRGRRGFGSRRRFNGRSRLARRVSRISRRLYSKGVYSAEINYVRANLAANVPQFQISAKPSFNLTGFATGDTDQTRDGSKIFVRHIKMNLGVIVPTPPTPQYASPFNSGGYQPWHRVTYLIARDMKPPSLDTNGVAGSPTLNDVFDFTFTTTPTDLIGTLRTDFVFNKVYKYDQNRWDIIKMGSVNLYANDAAGKSAAIIKKRFRIMKPTYYSADTANQNAAPGIIYCWIWNNHVTQTPTGTESPKYVGDFRISYTDL